MTIRKGAKPKLAVYLDNLLLQLRLREVPGDRIGQILAEVQTHVADTGLDPVDAFGEPGEYAATYAAAAGSAPARRGFRGWIRTLGVAVVGAFAGVAVSFGAMELAGSVDITLRLLGIWLATLAVGLLVMSVLWPQLKRDTARSFTPRRFTARFMVLGVLAWLAGVAALVPIGLLHPGPTLGSVPGWVLFVAGLLAFFALVRHLSGDRVVDPRG
jgi:hypothetical protein